jgi:hypothetical protein
MAKQYPAWMYAMLKQLGVTPSKENLYFLDLWTASEGTAGDHIDARTGKMAHVNNPLAITKLYDETAAWQTGIWNDVGVRMIDTPEHGGYAAAKFLQADKQNTMGYQTIIQALKSNSLQQMWSAVNKSHWCWHCDGGRYPGAIYAVLANGGNPPAVANAPVSTNTDAAGYPLPPVNSAYVDANGLPLTGNGDASTGVQAQEVGSGKKKNIVTCADKGAALKIGPSFFGTSISQCNVKALTGGMITILGVQMLFLGVVVVGLGLGLKTKTGQTVKRTAVKAGKTAITKRLPKPASATSAARNVASAPAPPAPPMTAARTTRAA